VGERGVTEKKEEKGKKTATKMEEGVVALAAAVFTNCDIS